MAERLKAPVLKTAAAHLTTCHPIPERLGFRGFRASLQRLCPGLYRVIPASRVPIWVPTACRCGRSLQRAICDPNGVQSVATLWGIDAVEGDQVCQRDRRLWRCGDEATAALVALIDGRELTCVEPDIDGYGRIVATCAVAGRDIGSAMVRQGWALDYERYSGGAYAAEQFEAEQAQRGLWSGSFVAPWGWRAGR